MSMYEVSDVSRILGVEKGTVTRWIRNGIMKATSIPSKGKTGYSYRISSDEVERVKTEYMSKSPMRMPRHGKKKTKIDPKPLYDEAHIIKRILDHNNMRPLDYVKMTQTGGWSYNLGIIDGKNPVPREFTKRFSEFFDVRPEELDIMIATKEYKDIEKRAVVAQAPVKTSKFEEAIKAVPEQKDSENDGIPVYNGQTGEKTGKTVTNLTVVQDIYYITVQSRSSDNPEWNEPHMLNDVVTFRFKKHAIEYLLNELPDSDPGYSYMKNPTKRQISEGENYILYTMVNDTTLCVTQIKFNINRAEVR